MKWLSQISSWLEVRRFLMVFIPVTAGTWAGVDKVYQKRMERNMIDVRIEQTMVEFSEKLDGAVHQIGEIKSGQDSLYAKFGELESKHSVEMRAIESKIQKNHDAFMFTVEHQGDVTREVMIDMVNKLSAPAKEEPPVSQRRYFDWTPEITFEPIED